VPEGVSPGAYVRFVHDGGDGAVLVPGSVSVVSSSVSLVTDAPGSWPGVAAAAEGAWGVAGGNVSLGGVSNADRVNGVLEELTVTLQMRVVNGTAGWIGGETITVNGSFVSDEALINFAETI
jgi:hypothetical protein